MVFLFSASGCDDADRIQLEVQQREEKERKELLNSTTIDASKAKEEMNNCLSKKKEIIDESAMLYKLKDYEGALNKIKNCHYWIGDDEEIKKINNTSQVRIIEKDLSAISGEENYQERLFFIKKIISIDDSEKAKYSKELKNLEAREAKQVALEKSKIALEKKKEGVRVGMSQDDVLASQWGKPIKINKTTNAYGVSEQWVYRGGYLYFENGILNTIQN